MTDLILRIFVRDHKNTEDPAVRDKCGRVAGAVGIVTNFLLFIRRFTCHFKADERDNGRAGICEVVDGIGRDGNTVKNRADDNLH